MTYSVHTRGRARVKSLRNEEVHLAADPLHWRSCPPWETTRPPKNRRKKTKPHTVDDTHELPLYNIIGIIYLYTTAAVYHDHGYYSITTTHTTPTIRAVHSCTIARFTGCSDDAPKWIYETNFWRTQIHPFLPFPSPPQSVFNSRARPRGSTRIRK